MQERKSIKNKKRHVENLTKKSYKKFQINQTIKTKKKVPRKPKYKKLKKKI